MSEILSPDVIRWIEIVIAAVVTFAVAYVVSSILTAILKKTSFPTETGKRIVRVTKYGIYALGTNSYHCLPSV